MILKRVIKENLVKALYDSSNIIGSIYNNDTNDLDLIFKAGTKYRYPNVSKSDYMRFEIAESQGVVFNTHIKRYPFVKLENVDIATILNEAEDLKAKEDAALNESKRIELVKQLKQALVYEDALVIYGKTPEEVNKLFCDSLELLQKTITDFLNLKK